MGKGKARMYCFDAYIVVRSGSKSFWFGSLMADVVARKGSIVKFKNARVEKLKDITSVAQAASMLRTPETFLPVKEAILKLCEENKLPSEVRDKALVKLRNALNATGVWVDIGTSTIYE